jgi:hypothetical protein
MALDVKVFCKISEYLEQHHPAVSRLIRATCTDGLLGTRGKPGTTFLVPSDATVAKLTKLVQSSSTKDMDEATDLICQHILRDHFASAADWKHKEPVTALEQVLEVDSATGTQVSFKNGAKAVLDTKFIDNSKKKNLAVWKISAGELGITTDKKPSGKAVKTGSYAQSADESATLRNKIMLVVENAFVEYLRDSADKCCDPFTAHLFSFISYLMHEAGDRTILYQRVLPLLCTDKVDLYFLIEPHRPIGRADEYLIPDEVIDTWWKTKTFDFAPAEICESIAEAIRNPEIADDSLFYNKKERESLLASIAALRNRYGSIADTKPRGITDQIHRMYTDFAASNSLGGGGVFPAPLAGYYKRYPLLKLAQDELRFITHWKFSEMCRNRGNVDVVELENLFNTIGEMLYTCYNGSKSAFRLLNADTIKFSIDPTEFAEEIRCFINSTAFLHIALTPEEYKKISPKSSVERPKSSKILYNIASAVQQTHQRVANYRSNDAVVSRLLSMDLSKLPESVREQLRKKLT